MKNVAKLLEDEQTETLKELRSLASKKAITVPAAPDEEDRRIVENLREKKDAEDFNKEWTKEMINQQEKRIEAFEDQLERTEDADLKALITQTLPDLRANLDKLRSCREKLKDA